MAKKSRRIKAKQLTKGAKATQRWQPQQPKPIAVKLQSSTGISPEVETLTSRYQYVMPEVKRISIIAGAIVVTLIILSCLLG
jgi:hypothetical protein